MDEEASTTLLKDITTELFILALFIRDDGKRFLLGSGAYEFKDSQLHFNANTLTNDVVELQGRDGQMLAGQVRRCTTQSFDGYVGDNTQGQAQTEDARKEFFAFFRKNHYYTVVYIFKDGTAIQRKRGYLVDAPSVQEIDQRFPEYHIGLAFEDVNYYEYAEDDNGDEKFVNTVDISVATKIDGGLIWDATGVVFDAIGAEWEAGGTGGDTVVTVNGIDDASPIWIVKGIATNPTLTNRTTGKSITWTGYVGIGETLVVNMEEMTAKLSGANVFGGISGDWLVLNEGNNVLSYSATGAETPCVVEWNGVVG